MTLIKLEFRRKRKSILIWSVVVLAMMALFMSLYPQMQTEEMAALAKIKLEGLSESLLAVFGLETMPDFTKVEEYFIYVFQYIFLAACVLAVILGFDLLQGEETSGNIEYLYAMPLSRKQIYFYKTIAIVALYTIFFVLVWLAAFALMFFLKPESAAASDIFNKTMYLSVMYTYLASLAYLALGILLSAAVHSYSRASSLALGVFFMTYVIGIIGNVVENAKILKYFSFYDYANPTNLFYHGAESVKVWILLGAVIVFVLLGAFIYEKKDFYI